MDDHPSPSNFLEGRGTKPLRRNVVSTVWLKRQARINARNYVFQTSWALWPLICTAILITTLCLSYAVGMARYPDNFVELEDPTQVATGEMKYAVSLNSKATYFSNPADLDATQTQSPQVGANGNESLEPEYANLAISFSLIFQNILAACWLFTHVYTFPRDWVVYEITWIHQGRPNGSTLVSMSSMIGWGAACLKVLLTFFMVVIVPNIQETSYWGLEVRHSCLLGYAMVQSWADVVVVCLADSLRDFWDRKILASTLAVDG